MFRYFIIPFISISLIQADDETLLEKKDLTLNKNKGKSKLPSLEILPAGSILKNICIPRYNPNYTNSSLLTAEELEIISSDEIKGSNVNIRLYGEDGVEKTQTTLNSVSLNQQTGIVTSLENLTFEGESFATSSQGIVVDVEKHRGFLLGRNHSIIYIKESESMINSKDKSNTAKKAPKKVLATAALATITSSPTLLTAQELTQIDDLAKPSTELFIDQLEQTKADLQATAIAEAKIEAIRKDLEAKLINKPQIQDNQAPPKELVPIEGRDHVKITSDRFFFDAKKGLFAYSGNIKITHPQYSFTCDGELQIVLKEADAVKKLPAKDRAKLKANEIFDNIEHLIATKNVVLRAKDDKGKNITAVTDKLYIQNVNILKVAEKKIVKDKETGKDVKVDKVKTTVTGDIVLKGKGSRLNTADGQMKVTTAKGYIKIDKDLNATGIDIEADFNIPENKDKPTN